MPVFLTKEEARLHYAGFCNDVLWPLFHYVVSRMPDIKTDLRSGFHAQWEAYQAVNGHFAAAVARVARPNDLVWVHWLHRRCGRLFTAAAVNRSGCTTTT